MKFKLQNIGAISETEIDLNKLTVLLGNNNTGKTYLTYSVFGFLDRLSKELEATELPSLAIDRIKNAYHANNEFIVNIRDFTNELVETIQNIAAVYTKELHLVFSANPEEFENSKFEYINDIDIEKLIAVEFESGEIENVIFKKEAGSEICKFQIKDNDFDLLLLYLSKFNTDQNKNSRLEEPTAAYEKKYLKEEKLVGELFKIFLLSVFDDYIFLKQAFILPAERTGILIFQNELDKNAFEKISDLKKSIYQRIVENKQDLFHSLLKGKTSRFALPIEKNIDFNRDIENAQKENSFLKEKYPELIEYIEDMLGVNYQIAGNQLSVIDKKSNTKIPSYLASTSVRSLFSLHLWLKHKLKEGDLLIIDEPELNLHPENQIQLARLFVRLVNAGVKVWITTHSDYLIKELNNLVMLSNNFENKEAVLTELGYTEGEILRPEYLNYYLAVPDYNFIQIGVDEYGAMETSFDETMLVQNKKSNRLIGLTDKLLKD